MRGERVRSHHLADCAGHVDDRGPVPKPTKPETGSGPGSITCRKRGGAGQLAAALNKAAGLRFDPLSLVPGKC